MDAYRSPFEVTRKPNGLQLTNRGPTEIRWVRFIAHGDGVAVARPIPRLAIGDTIDIHVEGDLARDTLLVVQWMRPDEAIYLASFAL